MKRYTLLVVFLALTACVAGGNALPAASTPASTTATAVATTEAAPTATATAALPAAATTVPTPLPTLDPTIERPDTPAPPLTPIPTATPAASGFVPPAPVAGFVDGLVLIPNDGSVIIYTPASGRVETLFGPNTYRLGSFDGPDPVWMPPRLSPDGRRLLLPRISDTWLAERAAPDATPAQATARPLIAERLWATWSPDSRRIVYTANSLVVGSQNPGAVYVQDVSGSGAAQLLVELPAEPPGTVFWPIWSPGCAAADAGGDCGRSIAALGAGDDDSGLAVWLIDSETGATRQLGTFRPPPIDLTDWLRWTTDGAGLIGRSFGYDVYFPLDGGALRPLVVETGAATPYGHVAPDGSSYLRLEYPDPETTRLVFGRLATGEEVVAPGPLQRVIHEGWTSDGRFVVISAVADGVAGLYAIDLAGWPAVGEPALLATDAYLLGLEWEMARRATVVDWRPWATTEPPLPAAPVAEWTRHEWAVAGLQVAAPPGWRFEVGGPYGEAVLANYAATSTGLVALGDEQVRVEMMWQYATVGELDPLSVEGIASTYFQHDVEAVAVGDITGARLTSTVSPVCEQLVFPHHDGQHRGELWLTYCPATNEWREFMVEFVAQLGLQVAVAP
jgi:hypothetical protein